MLLPDVAGRGSWGSAGAILGVILALRSLNAFFFFFGKVLVFILVLTYTFWISLLSPWNFETLNFVSVCPPPIQRCNILAFLVQQSMLSWAIKSVLHNAAWQHFFSVSERVISSAVVMDNCYWFVNYEH